MYGRERVLSVHMITSLAYVYSSSEIIGGIMCLVSMTLHIPHFESRSTQSVRISVLFINLHMVHLRER